MPGRRSPTRLSYITFAIAIALVLPIASPFMVATTHFHRRCRSTVVAASSRRKRLAAAANEGFGSGGGEKPATSIDSVAATDGIVVTGIESTPNPLSFLIQLEKGLPGLEFLSGSLRGETYYSESSRKGKRRSGSAPPDAVASILRLEDVDFVFAMPTVLTINKKAFGSWETLLPSVLESLLEGSPDKQGQMAGLLRDFGVPGNDDDDGGNGPPPAPAAGQVTIRIQTAGGIPIQIEAKGSRFGTVERRRLPQPKFQRAMDEVKERNPSFDFFGGRIWTDKGVRYISGEEDDDDDDDDEGNAGDTREESEVDPLLASLLLSSSSSEEDREKRDLDEVLSMESDEIDAAYPLSRLERIVAENCPGEGGGKDPDTPSERREPSIAFASPEQMDLAAVDAYCDASEAGDAAALAALVSFVRSRTGPLPARRNALAYLGGTAGLEDLDATDRDAVFAAVVGALRDERSPAMRRTAGDALSDLGDDRAVPHAIDALRDDRSKLVQWRAARILGELAGSAEAASVLESVASNVGYAFEVAFEIRDALRKVRARLDAQGGDGDDDGTVAPTGPMWKQIQEGTRKQKNTEL